MEQYYVCSLSGGKDSTAMFLELIRRKYPLDEVVYCDTGLEFPAMERHIEKLRKVAKQHGIKFTTLKSEKSFEYYMFDYIPKRRNKIIHSGKSWPDFKTRWCTYHLKHQILQKHFKEIKENYSLVCYIGLAPDETKRLQKEYNNREGKIYPLVEWGMTESDCLQYCYDHGYDWEGLYGIFKRVSCWCCPLQQIRELRNLRKYFPDLWEKLKDMDGRTWRSFRSDYSIDDLEVRFKLEEEFEAKGMTTSPYNKLFRETLKERLGRANETQTISKRTDRQHPRFRSRR